MPAVHSIEDADWPQGIAILRLISHGEGNYEQSETANFASRLASKRRPRNPVVKTVSIQLPMNGDARLAAIEAFKELRTPWELYVFAHGTDDGRVAAGQSGQHLGMLCSLIFGAIGKGAPQSVILGICFGGLRDDEEGVAGSFARIIHTRGMAAPVRAFPSLSSVDLAGDFFNPTGYMIHHEEAPNELEDKIFEIDGANTLRVIE